MRTYLSFSSRETKKFGKDFARRVLKNGSEKNAAVVALSGELGSGKTTFVQGFFRGLGLKRAPSPTFIIMRRSKLKNKKFKDVYHVDAYRIRKSAELRVLEFHKTLSDPKNIILIEWAENIKKVLPKNSSWIYFHHGKKENERAVRF